MSLINKSAISPLIATILLIVVAVSIIAIIVTWSKDFTLNSLEKTNGVISDSKYNGFLWSFETYSNNVLVENKSDYDINIIGYTINSLDHNGFWINSYHLLESTLTINAGMSDNISLICMPISKFLLNLRTSNNENISVNIKPNLTRPGDTCEEYNVSLWDFVSGTGAYTLEEIALVQGELNNDTNNRTFDSGVGDWLGYSGGTLEHSTDKLQVTLDNSGASGVRLLLSNLTNIKTGSKYRIKADVWQGTTSNNVMWLSLAGDAKSFIINGTQTTYETDVTCLDSSLYLYIFLSSTDTGTFFIDDVSVTEISPLSTIITGTKYLENTTAGTTAIESNQAYGTWEFDVFKGAGENGIKIPFIGANRNADPNFIGYQLNLNSLESIGLQESDGTTVANLNVTANSYISNNTWYRLKITRTTAGVFTVFIKGGAFGDTYTLVDVTGGSGTNPVTDTTYTTSNYIVADLDAGDKFANLHIISDVPQ